MTSSAKAVWQLQSIFMTLLPSFTQVFGGDHYANTFQQVLQAFAAFVQLNDPMYCRPEEGKDLDDPRSKQ